ncbi:APC5 protein [Coemansia sp. Benny D115]|nr:APC5 protein [Coemansia sp. Benny D115]
MNHSLGAGTGAGIGYLSASKMALLLCIDQYARNHGQWDSQEQAHLGAFLAQQLYRPIKAISGWPDLQSKLQEIHPGPNSMWAELQRRLTADLVTLDALHGLFDSLRRLIAQDTDAHSTLEGADGCVLLLDSESILGIFVRRCCLAFDQLEFHQTSSVLAQCRLLVEPTGDEPLHASAMEEQEHVEHLIALLEDEAGCPVPQEMEQQITRAARTLSGHARLQYLQSLSLVRAGESFLAEQTLRRFFDSTALKDNRTAYQYALLYLAAQRTELGMWGEAQGALQEAIQVARDCQDHQCLLWAAAWQARALLTRGTAGVSPADAAWRAVRALKDKAQRMACWPMVAHALLLRAELLLATDRDMSSAFAILVAIQALVVEHDLERLLVAWHIASARTWLHCVPQAPGASWLALLHLQEARLRPVAERERAEILRQTAIAQSVLSGPQAAVAELAAAIDKEGPRFAHPGRLDDIMQTLQWLRISNVPVSAVQYQPQCVGHYGGGAPMHAQLLVKARDLAAAGFLCEARETIAEITAAHSDPALVSAAARLLSELDAGEQAV